MEIKEKFIVSEDVNLILNGNNALNYSYNDNGIIIPSLAVIESLRRNLNAILNKIFNGSVKTISEEALKCSMNENKYKCGDYPHCYA